MNTFPRLLLLLCAALFCAVRPVSADTSVPPVYQTVDVGTKLTLAVGGSGTFQWSKDDVLIAGATSSNYIINSAKASDTGTYTCRATRSDGVWIYSFNVTVVGQSGVVTARPQNQSVKAGEDATFSVTASGTDLSYQWKFNGTALAGATSSTLTLHNVGTHQRGTYSVAVSNGSGLVEEAPATLTVTSSARLANLSTRAWVGGGDDVAIVGVVLQSTGSKPVLFRGAGPTLASYGVNGVLATPQLSLRASSGTVLHEETGPWGGGSELTQLFTKVGAAPWASDSADAAFVTNLSGSAYTTIVSGGGKTGIALAELYDADTAQASPRLMNISTRARVGPGDQTVIAGFVITGSTSETVLIRALGPTLRSKFGLSAALTRPRLTVFNQQGASLAANTAWGDDPLVAPTGEKVGASPLDAGSQDAALIMTLAPGVYSAQVTSETGGTGTTLVEVYEVP